MCPPFLRVVRTVCTTHTIIERVTHSLAHSISRSLFDVMTRITQTGWETCGVLHMKGPLETPDGATLGGSRRWHLQISCIGVGKVMHAILSFRITQMGQLFLIPLYPRRQHQHLFYSAAISRFPILSGSFRLSFCN